MDCAYCKERIAGESIELLGREVCKKCIGRLHDAIEVAYQRLYNYSVPSRRGGFRKLGDLDN